MRLPITVSVAVSGVFIAFNTYELGGRPNVAMFDDALISMDYARNLATGQGLVWSPGGPLVEGYTNPLWVFVMAAVHRVGSDEHLAPFVVAIISAAILVGCVVVAARLAALVSPRSRLAPTAAGLLVALDYPLVYWSLRGTEQGLFTLLMLAAMWAVARVHSAGQARRSDLVLLGAALSLGVLTRTDFVVPAAVVLAWSALVLRGSARRSVVVVGVGVLAATLGLHSLWRVMYYGELLPNTYTLKVGGVALTTRLGRGLLSSLVFTVTRLLVPAVIVAIALRIKARVSRPLVALIGATAITIGAYSAWVGGDAWEWTVAPNRFLVPAGVLAALLAGACIEPVAQWALSHGRVLWLVGIGAMAVLAGWLGWDALVAAGVPLDRLFAALPLDRSMVSVALLTVVAGAVTGLVLARPQTSGDGRSDRGSRTRLVTSVVLVMLIIGLNGAGMVWYATTRDTQVAVPRAMAELGLQIKAVTTPDATVAVVWAGAPLYFSGRQSIDLLGKADRVVASSPPHTDIPFRPGHVKWDYAYSIGQLRPDLIAQVWHPTASDLDAFVAEGYVPVEAIGSAREHDDPLQQDKKLFARKDSPNLRWELLRPVPPDWH